jgi:hypothetical protein
MAVSGRSSSGRSSYFAREKFPSDSEFKLPPVKVRDALGIEDYRKKAWIPV